MLGTKINPYISDLFFNLDLKDTKTYDFKGNFKGFNHEDLDKEADWFLDALSRLGVDVPTKEELIEDFFDRFIGMQ